MFPFEILGQIGEGTYGRVFRARCQRTNRIVALKRIEVANEKEGIPLTAMREAKILRGVAPHPNIVTLLDIVPAPPSALYVALEYVEFDLVGLESFLFALGDADMQPGERTRSRLAHNLPAVRCIMRQLIAALEHLHVRHGVVHRDLKGSNVLLGRDGVVRLADFGLAKAFLEPDVYWPSFDAHDALSDAEGYGQRKRHQRLMTNRVVTLWFRPPEILLGSTSYGPAADMWGAGCVLAEMLAAEPAFTAPDELGMLDCLCKKLGPLPPDMASCSAAPLPWLDEATKIVRSSRVTEGKPDARAWALGLCAGDVSCADFLLRLLDLSPDRRIDAATALRHPFLAANALDPRRLLPSLCADAGADVSVLGDGEDWHEMTSRSHRR